MLSRLVVGARLTFVIAGAGVIGGALIGSLLGLIAGYFRGWVDLLVSRLVDAQLALPGILLAMAIVTAHGRSLRMLVLILILISWAPYARVIRSEVLSLRERQFVTALRSSGFGATRIILKHMAPNVANTFLVLAALEVGILILAESALSFLGLGIVSPDISWGQMLAEGRGHMHQAWWVVGLPGLAISSTVLMLNFLGDALRARYDPREKIY